jgi:DNA-binding transcriptional LysR family regulator
MPRASEPVETAELLAFTRTVEAKSVSRAAAELGVPRATLGRRLARLESRLGSRLVLRNSRRLSLTEAGDRFYRHARLVLDSLAAAEASVRTDGDPMRGDLRVSVPPLGVTSGTADSFYAMVASFARTHPNVRIQIHVSSRVVDLLREGYDVALRSTSQVQPGLIARTLERNKLIAVAAPDYLREHGTPRAVEDLRRHRCLATFAHGELPQRTWPASRGIAHVESSFSSNDPALLREVALKGLGIALLPRLLVHESLETGALVQVLAGVVEAEHHVAVVYPEREFLPAHVRAFVDALVEWAPDLHRTGGPGRGRGRRTARPSPRRSGS